MMLRVLAIGWASRQSRRSTHSGWFVTVTRHRRGPSERGHRNIDC